MGYRIAYVVVTIAVGVLADVDLVADFSAIAQAVTIAFETISDRIGVGFRAGEMLTLLGNIPPDRGLQQSPFAAAPSVVLSR